MANAINASALDVPAGTLRTPGGDILLEPPNAAISPGSSPRSRSSAGGGAKVRLGDIATVIDGFEESERENYFNGRRAVSMEVFSSENQSPIAVARRGAAFHRGRSSPTSPTRSA